MNIVFNRAIALMADGTPGFGDKVPVFARNWPVMSGAAEGPDAPLISLLMNFICDKQRSTS
jgi:hypothetical protein